MKAINGIALFTLLLSTAVHGQQPVKYQLIKMAEKIILPPNTPAEAYQKTEVKGEVDENRMFGSFYDWMKKTGMELHTQTTKQIRQNVKERSAGEQAMADGFGDMNTSEQAKYLKSHPQLQQATGVNSSMMELATKMQDPAFRKKFDAMSDEEKARLVKQYQQPQIAMNRKSHSQEGLKNVTEAARLIDQFNRGYYKGGLAGFGNDRLAKEKALDEKEELALKPVQEEKHRLMQSTGKGMTDAQTRRLKEVMAKEWTIKNKALEKKLSFYQSEVNNLTTRFKLAVKPFDDFLARINYGRDLDATNEAKELAQLAGYQEGMLKVIVDIQDLAKDITVRAAQFYREKLENEKGK
jgi:transposase-like protein